MKTKINIYFSKLLKYVLLFLALALIGIVIFWALLPDFSPSWSGFGMYQNSKGEFERAKTLWDWMNLLIVPLIIAIGVWYLNKSEKQNDQKNTRERINEQTLQSYLDYMTVLILKENLISSSENDSVRSIARSRTATALRILDSIRKGILINFINESSLIGKDPIIILKGMNISLAHLNKAKLPNSNFRFANLKYAKLSNAKLAFSNFQSAQLDNGDLSNADLESADLYLVELAEANLSSSTLVDANLTSAKMTKCNLQNSLASNANFTGANLSYANLKDADLSGADFTHANLYGANLKNANLKGSKLIGTNLTKVDFTGANLDNADLSLSNLTRAKITGNQLKNVKSLILTTMVDGKSLAS